LSNTGGNIVSFEQLAGQSALVSRIQAALRQGRVAHAVIISGPSGSGKRTLAALWARALLCSSSAERPCGVCASCKKAMNGNHPDLYTIKPDTKSKALGVDDVRAVQRLIEMKPYEGGHAVIVVQSAHDLTHQAQNALLKTLEEPPENTVLLLLAETLSPLLPTILSRCIVYNMGRIETSEMLALLQDKGYPPNGKTAQAAQMADGRPGRALELLADDAYWDLRRRAIDTLENLVSSNGLAAAMKFVQDNRARITDVLEIWACALRDAAVTLSQSGIMPLSGEANGFLLDAGMDRLVDMLSACTETSKALDGNAIYLIAMDKLLLSFSGGI
jgi:DNA polymerase III subunit delta'